MSIKYLRICVLILGLTALTALFLKLPELSSILVGPYCPLCVSNTLFLVLMGSGYFSLLIALALLFPSFPHPLLARLGLLGSFLLAIVLIYLKMPDRCLLCVIGHICNIAIWAIWSLEPKRADTSPLRFDTRLYLAFLAPISVIALFSSINLLFLSYDINHHAHAPNKRGVYTGDPTPSFIAQTIEGVLVTSKDKTKTILNFVMPQCPHCEEQLQILHEVVQNSEGAYRVVNISPQISPEMIQRSPSAEWVEDTDLQLQKLFKTHGSPTLYMLGEEGRISQIILGVPDGFKETLQQHLPKGKASL